MTAFRISANLLDNILRQKNQRKEQETFKCCLIRKSINFQFNLSSLTANTQWPPLDFHIWEVYIKTLIHT